MNSLRVPRTFRNPLFLGADPWVLFQEGNYYYCGSGEGNSIYIIKSPTLSGLASKDKSTVWKAPIEGRDSKEIWAPELHLLNGRWYIYYAADDGDNSNHRMFVLESAGSDPLGAYIERGQITDETDKWAIDGTILQSVNGSIYFIWSGWENDTNVQQNLYIAPMNQKEPWKITGKRVLLSSPTYDWERIGTPYVNEGPQVLRRNGKTFVIYSASGSWTPDYCLCALIADDRSDMMDAMSWVKYSQPVFSRNDTEGVYGVGHASFTTSSDGTQDFIVYHAMSDPQAGWMGRSVRIQPFNWHDDGTPHFGVPLSTEKDVL